MRRAKDTGSAPHRHQTISALVRSIAYGGVSLRALHPSTPRDQHYSPARPGLGWFLHALWRSDRSSAAERNGRPPERIPLSEPRVQFAPMPLPQSIPCNACKRSYPEGWKRCPFCGVDPLQGKRDAENARFIKTFLQKRAATLGHPETERSSRGKRERRRGRGRRGSGASTAPPGATQPQKSAQQPPRQPQQQGERNRPQHERPQRQPRRGGPDAPPPSGEAPVKREQRGRPPRPPRSKGDGAPQQQRSSRPPQAPDAAHQPAAAGAESEAARKNRRRRRRRGRGGSGGGAPTSTPPGE